MKIFISWSEQRSKLFATRFTNWIQCVIQGVRPWISTHDIPDGSIWFNEIAKELSDTQRGVICLTKENLRNPWLLFEAGALFKGLPTSRVRTILIGIDPGEVPSPLGQFNHTKTTEDGIWKLVHEINQEMKEQAMKPSTLKSVFDKYWDDFQVFLHEAEEIKIDAVPANDFSEKQMMAEILALVRNQGSAAKGEKRPVRRDLSDLQYQNVLQWIQRIELGTAKASIPELDDVLEDIAHCIGNDAMSDLQRGRWDVLRTRIIDLAARSEVLR